MLRFFKIRQESFIAITLSLIVGVASYYLAPLYYGGDQEHYIEVYEKLASASFVEGFFIYQSGLSSKEFVHFVLSYIFSKFVEKSFFVGFFNGVLAYVSVKALQRIGASLLVASFIVVTNYYFMVLFFAAERLKFGFIFLALSVIFLNVRIRLFLFYCFLALAAHVQIVLFYGAGYIFRLSNKASRLLKYGLLSKEILIFFLLVAVSYFAVGSHFVTKFYSYFSGDFYLGSFKVVAFMILVLIYKRGLDVFLCFLALFVSSILVGESRIVIVAYFMMLYFLLPVRRGFNFAVLLVSIYFAAKSVEFWMYVLDHGHGFST